LKLFESGRNRLSARRGQRRATHPAAATPPRTRC
jgi:hypothetical protein